MPELEERMIAGAKGKNKMVRSSPGSARANCAPDMTSTASAVARKSRMPMVCKPTRSGARPQGKSNTPLSLDR